MALIFDGWQKMTTNPIIRLEQLKSVYPTLSTYGNKIG